MVAIRFIRHRPDGQAQVQEVSASVGQSVMRAAVDAAVDGIAADCGGVLVFESERVTLSGASGGASISGTLRLHSFALPPRWACQTRAVL